MWCCRSSPALSDRCWSAEGSDAILTRCDLWSPSRSVRAIPAGRWTTRCRRCCRTKSRHRTRYGTRRGEGYSCTFKRQCACAGRRRGSDFGHEDFRSRCRRCAYTALERSIADRSAARNGYPAIRARKRELKIVRLPKYAAVILSSWRGLYRDPITPWPPSEAAIQLGTSRQRHTRLWMAGSSPTMT